MSESFPVTIYHNPACGTSRNALEMIRQAGYAPTVIEYLKTGWTRAKIDELLAALAASPRDILRAKGTPAEELGLLEASASDAQIIEAMLAHPILVNRPIVVTKMGARLARPSEVVFEILDKRPAEFRKEDGEVVRARAPTGSKN
ncbi:MAG: arsenate reductase (glutaredoxin) [Telmatospirillum sp.]|nr:arsenate reductase (glutaredoxin) [Telmatospirillum sp.]